MSAQFDLKSPSLFKIHGEFRARLEKKKGHDNGDGTFGTGKINYQGLKYAVDAAMEDGKIDAKEREAFRAYNKDQFTPRAQKLFDKYEHTLGLTKPPPEKPNQESASGNVGGGNASGGPRSASSTGSAYTAAPAPAPAPAASGGSGGSGSGGSSGKDDSKDSKRAKPRGHDRSATVQGGADSGHSGATTGSAMDSERARSSRATQRSNR